MSNKPVNGQANGAKSDDGRKSGGSASDKSIAQGLQSVMAVIGETYDSSGGVHQEPVQSAAPKPPKTTAPATSTTKLTDKIDASRQKQAGESSVTQGLQSIMAVIGENYEEEEAAPAPTRTASVSAPTANSPQTKVAETVSAAKPTASGDNMLSDLVPLLTDNEKQIAHSHDRASDSGQEGASTGSLAGSDVRNSGLLGQLQEDIIDLEQQTGAAVLQPADIERVTETAPDDLRSVLTQLQNDISALRHENDALKMNYNIPVQGQGGEVAALLSQLQGDIVGLRQENDALKSKFGIASGAVGGNSEISFLLSQLQGDITGLRKENDAFKARYNVPAASSRGMSFGQAFLMSIGLLALIGGAMFGGFYYANTMNAGKQDSLLAMLGLQQARLDKVEAKTEEVNQKVQVKATPASVPKVVVAAKPATPPPALPKITVKKPQLDTAEVQALITDAQNLIELGDLVSARQMLEYAVSQKSAEAAFKLAQTFDPLYLARIASVLSVEPDLTRAKVLYYSAARLGHQAAAKRLAELRKTPGQ